MLRKVDLAFILSVAVVVSLSSMGYELLLIRLLSSITGDSVLSQSLTAGCFLLSLGFGAYLYEKTSRRSVWETLLRVEVSLALIAVVALPVIALSSIYIVSKTRLIIAAQVVTLLIGTLSGFELPALMEVAKPLTRRWFGTVLAANYIGALIASVAFPFWLLPAVGIYFGAWMLSLVSAAIAACVFLRTQNFRPRLVLLPLIASVFLPPIATSFQDRFEQFYLKSFYYLAPAKFTRANFEETLKAHASLPRIQRFTTPYQDIDIVKDDLRVYGLNDSNNFHLFIDQHKQFGSATESIYHDTIVHGGLNLAHAVPSDVLIVGGGDGLMVRELLKYPGVKSITLVELDPEMIKLARTYSPLRSLNKGSLDSPKVHVELADGFTWMRDKTGTFDAIFIDLPHPISTDLSRLYSYEFYTFVRRRLKPNGFMIFDFPFDGIVKSSPEGSVNRTTMQSILSAIGDAGFQSRAAFGSWESFMIARVQPSEFKFDYETLSPLVQDDSVFNLTLVELHERVREANTVYKPLILKPENGGGS